MISSIANFIYELPHELPNNLRLKISGNKEILGKCEIWVEPSAQCPPPRNKTAAIIAPKKQAKVDIKLFLSCGVLLYFSNLFKRF